MLPFPKVIVGIIVCQHSKDTRMDSLTGCDRAVHLKETQINVHVGELMEGEK